MSLVLQPAVGQSQLPRTRQLLHQLLLLVCPFLPLLLVHRRNRRAKHCSVCRHACSTQWDRVGIVYDACQWCSEWICWLTKGNIVILEQYLIKNVNNFRPRGYLVLQGSRKFTKRRLKMKLEEGRGRTSYGVLFQISWN